MFGRNQRITGLSATRNFELLYELNQRNPSGGVFKQFDGTFSVESVLASPWLFKALMGTVTDTSLGGGSFAHLFQRTKTLPSFAAQLGFAASGGNITKTVLGGVCKSMTITAAVNEMIKARFDGFYALESEANTIGSSSVDAFSAFSFAGGTLTIGGITIGEVQSFEVTIDNSTDPVYQLSNQFANEVIAKQFVVSAKLDVTFKNANDLTAFTGLSSTYGTPVYGTPTATTQGTAITGTTKLALTAVDGSTIEIDLGGTSYVAYTGAPAFTATAYITDMGIVGLEPNTLIKEDVTLQSFDAQIVAVNSTAVSL